MNLLHMKYAVEIAETNSINKAADKLYVGQSALSRAIKELEASIGVTLSSAVQKECFSLRTERFSYVMQKTF